MKYIYIFSLILFSSKSVATVLQKEQQLDPKKYFVSFDRYMPFENISIIIYDNETDEYEEIQLDPGDYFLGSSSSPIKFKFSVDHNHKITGTYYDEDFWYDEEYEEEGIHRDTLHQYLEIVNSKAISENITSSNSKFVTTYNHNTKTTLEKRYNENEQLIEENEYICIEDEYEHYMSLIISKEYDIQNKTYHLHNYNASTKSYFSKKDKLLKIEHLANKRTDFYNTKGKIVEIQFDASQYKLDQSFHKAPFTYSIKREKDGYEEEITLRNKIKYSIIKDSLAIVSFITDKNALIQNEIKVLRTKDVFTTITVENSQPRYFDYKDTQGQAITGRYNKKDSTFVITSEIQNDTIARVEQKMYLTKNKENKSIYTAYLKNGRYIVANEIENSIKEYNEDHILESSKSIDGENKNDSTYDQEGKMSTSSYVNNGIRYNDVYEEGKLSQRSYATIDGDYIEYFKQGKLHKVEQTYYNDDGILYLKEYDDKWKVKKDTKKLNSNNEIITITERDVLRRLIDLNPNNKLDWDLSEPNLNRLDGITIYSKQDNDKSERVRELIIAKEGIDILPREIKHLKYLYFLGLSHNNLKSIPEEVGELKELTTLYLENNQLTALPNSLKNLDNLYRLILSNNQFKEIPEFIFELKDNRFSELEIDHNQISTIPTSIKKMERLDNIDLANNNFTSISKVLFQLPNLTSLKMSNNRITSIPKEIKKLKKLKILSLDSNEINNFPAEIGLLKNIETINLSNNNITALPEEITTLEHLDYLNLDDNKIEELPKNIDKLQKLESLDISDNNLRSIPENLSKLSALNYLNISYNNITTLPATISNLKNLKELRLYGNYLMHLSTKICDMVYNDAMEEFLIGDTVICTDEVALYTSYDAAVKNKIMDLFNDYKPTIEEAENAEIASIKTIIGDLNNDGLTDGLLYFTFNNDTPPQTAIYISYDGQIEVIGGFEPEFTFDVTKIENNVVYLVKGGKTEEYILDNGSLIVK